MHWKVQARYRSKARNSFFGKPLELSDAVLHHADLPCKRTKKIQSSSSASWVLRYYSSIKSFKVDSLMQKMFLNQSSWPSLPSLTGYAQACPCLHACVMEQHGFLTRTVAYVFWLFLRALTWNDCLVQRWLHLDATTWLEGTCLRLGGVCLPCDLWDPLSSFIGFPSSSLSWGKVKVRIGFGIAVLDI